jgi:hypothetical protein
MALPPIDDTLSIAATLPSDTIGEELPREGLGDISSPLWHANLGGFTQRDYSEALAFPPGTKITIRNLSKTTPHTLDVIAEIKGPPAAFPAHPTLSLAARGGDKLQAGYASGIIQPGHSITVVLKKGIYLIGCAFHYSQGMHDVIVVEDGAKPGPQATPLPTPSPTPSPSPSPSPSATPSSSPSSSPTTSPSPGITVIPSSVTVCIVNDPCSTTHAQNAVPVQVLAPGNHGPFTVNDSACTANSGAYVTPLQGYGPFTVYGESVPMQCTVNITEGGLQGTLYVNVVSN